VYKKGEIGKCEYFFGGVDDMVNFMRIILVIIEFNVVRYFGRGRR
jgi:hypothetical protein